MLNISPKQIDKYLDQFRYDSLRNVQSKTSGNVMIRLLTFFFITFLIMMFVPWTQNIRARGNVTTIHPEQRPQTLNTVIAGRIEKWFVKEGDHVNKGDTILYISEIKDKYFDPELLSRTQEQLKAKEMSVDSYMSKIKALDSQIDALIETGELKIEQANNKLKQANLKVQSDSIDLEAYKTNYNITKAQLERMDQMYEQGLKSKTDLEKREMSLQKAQAQLISGENKLLASRNEVINARVELVSLRAQYKNSIAKTESNKFTALSNMYDAEAVVTKLQNEYMNYSVRTGMYYITAPQDGYITKLLQQGIGETVKEGEEILTIMPSKYELAVELFVRPIDLPLIEKGQHVRIQFDGWPAIVFSGWPNTSYGTYGGEVFAIDNYISANGHFRVLVKPDEEDHPWPDALRVGGGSSNILLLKDVPIWYEIWRQINGFPPDFYKTQDTKATPENTAGKKNKNQVVK